MYVIITSNKELADLAMKKGEQVVKVNQLVENLEVATPKAEKPKKVIDNLELDGMVTKTLLQLGVPAHISGFDYLRYALNQLVTDSDFSENGVVEGIYPNIANHFGTTGQRVERALRHAIEVSADRGDIQLFQKVFSFSINSKKGKPTNAEFLYAVANYINLKLKEN